MSRLLNSKTALQPRPAFGSIYFSQAHSLRWFKSGGIGAKILYREMLSYALFFESLIISDSHAVGNWEILEMLPGGRFTAQCPGMEGLFRSGIIRIARRERASLEEIAIGQIRRNSPTMISGKLTTMNDSFIRAANRLQEVSSTHEFVYEMTNLRLADLLEREVLDVDSVSQAYGVKTVSLRKEIIAAVKELGEDGLLFASDLFNFRKPTGPLSRSDNISLLQRLATSTHSCNFAISLGLTPSVSPNSDDHKGATSLYERFTPELNVGVIDEIADDFTDPSFSPTKLFPVAASKDLIQLGIEPILELRDTPAFRRLQECRESLFAAYRNCDIRMRVTSSATGISKARIKFADAMVDYLAVISRKYGISTGSAAPPSEYLSDRLAASSRNRERLREYDTAGFKYLTTAVATLVTALVAAGVAPQAILFATSGVYAATGAGLMLRIRQLNAEREKIEACSRVLNLVGSSTS